MSAARRGTYREKLTAARLRKEGYYVMESRGSHGHADLLAVKIGQVLAVQVKTGDTELRGAWLNELYAAAVRAGMVPLVADFPKRGTLRLRQITGLHVPRSQRWPLVPFTTDEIAGRP